MWIPTLRMPSSSRVFLLAVAAWLALGSSSLATYPGQNGVVAFTAEDKPTADATHAIGLFSIPLNVPIPRLGIVQLTTGEDYSVSYSADGRKIAFARFPGGYLHATEQDLFVANADGTSPALVFSFAPNGYGSGSVALSPDGNQILFDDTQDLYRINVDGSGLQLVANLAGYGQWSPDGTKIAYSQHGASNIYADLKRTAIQCWTELVARRDTTRLQRSGQGRSQRSVCDQRRRLRVRSADVDPTERSLGRLVTRRYRDRLYPH